MSITRLWHLIIKQHGIALLLILLVGVGLSTVDGVSGSKTWHVVSTSERTFFPQEKQDFENHKHGLVDSSDQRYHTWTAYVNGAFQVYRQAPNNKLNSTRDRWTNGFVTLLLLLSSVSGVWLVSFSRKKFLTEFLLGFGYSRRQILNSILSIYSVAIIAAITLGTISKTLVLYLTIPRHYFEYFTWGHWFGNLSSDLLIAVMLFLLAVMLNMVINNYVVVVLITGFLYLNWFKVWAIVMLTPQSDIYSDYFSMHWQIGLLVTVILIIGLTIICNYLTKQYSSEMQSEPLTIEWLKPVVFGVFAIFGTLTLGHFLEKQLLALPIFISYIIAAILMVLILTVWLYRPKWSRRLWELTAELR